MADPKIEYDIKDVWNVTYNNKVGAEDRGNVAITPTGDEELIVGSYIDLQPDHHWKLQEISGTVVEDEGSSPINGTSIDVTINQTGKIDKSYLFNGTDEYVEVTHDSSLNLGSSFSIGCWLYKVTDTASGEILLAKCSSGANNMEYYVYLKGSGEVKVGFYDDTTPTNIEYLLTGNTSIPKEEWHHIFCLFDGTRFYIYIDGNLDAKGFDANDPSGKSPKAGSNPLYFGRGWFPSVWVYNFNGKLEDIRIYDGSTLTPKKMDLIYNVDRGTLNQTFKYTDLQPDHHWKLEDRTQSATGMVNDGINSTVTGDNQNATINITGKIGQAYSFDGAAEYTEADSTLMHYCQQ